MKNKFKSLVCVGLLTLGAAAYNLTSCGGTESNATDIVAECQSLSYSEIVEKAKAEYAEAVKKNADAVVTTYGNSSAFSNAVAAFTEETGIKVKNEKKGDAVTYQELSNAFAGNAYIADMVLLQDANSLKTQMIEQDYVLNYLPKDNKDNMADDDKSPTAAVYLNKVFMYNNTDFNGKNGETAKTGAVTHMMTNIWQVAGKAEDAGHISNVSFKSPSGENVNMNFLVMLTTDKYVNVLKDAYKAFYGKDYVEEKQYKNIGYKFIAEFLKNTTPHDSDGTACKNTAKGNSKAISLVNFNKTKDLKETGVGKTDKANLSFPSLEEENTFKGFSGFCYKMYAMVTKNAKYPYTACALVNYITSKAGYEASWGGLQGYYSTNKTVSIAEGDKALSWWKERLVVEDVEELQKNYTDVYQFVQQYESK